MYKLTLTLDEHQSAMLAYFLELAGDLAQKEDLKDLESLRLLLA